MTYREAAICEIFTGITFLTGEDRKYISEYVSELMGYPVYTHALPRLSHELKEKAREDFIKMCESIKED